MIQRVVRLVCQKLKLVSVSFAKLQFWIEGKEHKFMNQKCSNESNLLDLRVWYGVLQAGESSWSLEQNLIGMQYKSPSWTRMKKRLIHSNLSKNINGFLHKVE